MSWSRAIAAPALAEVLKPIGPSVFPDPPATFNVPALIVQFPTVVTLHTPTLALDLAELAVLCVVAAEKASDLDGLMREVTAAIHGAAQLGGAVQLCQVTEWRNWRGLLVGGADYLSGEVVCQVRM